MISKKVGVPHVAKEHQEIASRLKLLDGPNISGE